MLNKNIRLFNDDGCESLTPEAEMLSNEICDILRPVVNKAVDNNISLRDLNLVITAETQYLINNALNQKWMQDIKAKRESRKVKHREAIKNATLSE